ncbi:MAG: hypothetical protein MUC56_15255 [Thermoanaerobaculales bacterium]|nr:hypothetical protein [Thermoanaerobaculales bacterium]
MIEPELPPAPRSHPGGRPRPGSESADSPGQPSAPRRARRALPLLAALVATACLIAVVYCSAERYIYYWDYGGFWQVTAQRVALLKESPVRWLLAIGASLDDDYPQLYTVPPTPLLLAVGTSRMAYILSLTLVYQLPFALLMGAIAAGVVRRDARATFWTASFLTLLVPTAWMATLRGYPDAGAAALLALATWAWVRDPRLRDRRTILAIGVALALAPIFRRHFAYSSIAFFAAAGATSLLHAARDARVGTPGAWRRAAGEIARLAAAGLVFAGVMLTVGLPWLRYALSLDRSGLYRSYERVTLDWLRWQATSFGAVIWLLAALGLAIALAAGVCSRRRTVFLTITGGSALAIWAAAIRQVGWQYQLHFAPLVILGLTLLVRSTVEKVAPRAARVGVVAALLGLLAANLAAGLAGLQPPRLAEARWLLAEPSGPLHRSDYDEVMRLVATLRERVAEGDRIYVVDSSHLLNDDLLRKAELAAYGADDQRLDVLVSPHVDSRDYLPLENVLTSTFVVTSDPFQSTQSHLPVPQKVVVAGARAVLGGWRTARDFERLPTTFILGDGTSFSILRRVRHTPWDRALRTLLTMDELVGDGRPRFDWYWLQQPGPSTLEQTKPGAYACRTRLGFSRRPPWAPVLAYIGPLGASARLDLTVRRPDDAPGQARIRVWSANRKGETANLLSAPLPAGRSAGRLSLPLDLPAGARAVVLELSVVPGDPSTDCGALVIDDLSVTPDAEPPPPEDS